MEAVIVLTSTLYLLHHRIGTISIWILNHMLTTMKVLTPLYCIFTVFLFLSNMWRKLRLNYSTTSHAPSSALLWSPKTWKSLFTPWAVAPPTPTFTKANSSPRSTSYWSGVNSPPTGHARPYCLFSPIIGICTFIASFFKQLIPTKAITLLVPLYTWAMSLFLIVLITSPWLQVINTDTHPRKVKENCPTRKVTIPKEYEYPIKLNVEQKQINTTCFIIKIDAK